MGGPQVPGAYMIEEAGGQPTMDPSGAVTPAPAPAIPAAGQDVTQSQIGQDDAWALAGPATKAMLPEIWKATFPGKEPGAELSKEEMIKWKAAGTTMRNANVDRFEHQLEMRQKDKDREARATAALPAEELTIKQRADYIKGFMDDHAKILGDPMNPMSKQLQGITAQQYAQERLQSIEASLSGQAIPEEGQPAVGGQPGAIPAQGAPASPAQVGNEAFSEPQQSAPMDLRKEIAALAAVHGRTPEGKAKAIAELRQRYPQLQIR
jgi:hypothetical protein